MARLATVSDEADDAGATAEAGWRAIAGSLDDPGFASPPPPAAVPPSEQPQPSPSSAPDDLAAAGDRAADHLVDAASGRDHGGHPRPMRLSRLALGLLVAAWAVAMVAIGGYRIRLAHLAIVAPGTTVDIEEFVEVVDHPAYASDASIDLVSVRTSFDPSLFQVVGGWLDGALEVVDVVDILGERTVAQNREAGRRQMDQSTQVAVAVALEHLGHDIMTPIGARVARTMPDTPAHDALRLDDIVVSLDDLPIATASELASAVRSHQPGAQVVLTVVDVDGEERAVTVTLTERDGAALLGVIVATYVTFAELPVDVSLNVDEIGGPSAGLAFTLSVIDALTPADLSGRLDVAATGTIAHDGTVGPVGGVPQKAHAVLRAGSDLFLVPASQAAEAAEVAEPSVTVVGVESLDEALAAIAAHQ